MGKLDGNVDDFRATVSVPGQVVPGVPPLPSNAHSAPLRPRERKAQARRLIAAANELLAIAAELEHVADQPATSLAATNALDDEGRWLNHARRTYRNRRSRPSFFADDLFGEPAWDLLLDLFIAAKERKRVPVTSACIGAAVPTTTALRWLAILEERGLIVREADETDARRIFVRLTTDAYAQMVAYFVRAAQSEADEAADGVRQGSRPPSHATEPADG